jgi:hypothetical protein
MPSIKGIVTSETMTCGWALGMISMASRPFSPDWGILGCGSIPVREDRAIGVAINGVHEPPTTYGAEGLLTHDAGGPLMTGGYPRAASSRVIYHRKSIYTVLS